MLMKQNQHTPALYTNKKNVRYEKQSIKYYKWNETKQRLLSLPNKYFKNVGKSNKANDREQIERKTSVTIVYNPLVSTKD